MDAYFSLKKYIPSIIISLLDSVTHHKYTTILSSTSESFKENYYKENYKKISSLFLDKTVPDRLIYTTVSRLFTSISLKKYIDISYMFGLFLENLHSLTIQADLIGMKHSVEIRSLFLEKRVIERSFSLSLWQKISVTRLIEGKEILRKHLLNIFPRDFIYAKKIGF